MDHMLQQSPCVTVAASGLWVGPILRFIFASFLVSVEINECFLTGAETPALGCQRRGEQ